MRIRPTTMASVQIDYPAKPLRFDLEESSLLEPLPFDYSDTGLEISLSSIMLDTTTSKKRRRRVSFRDVADEIIVPSFACLAEPERRRLWYRRAEIEEFRSSARDACRRLRDNPRAYPEDSTRGLELRKSLDRQWRKHLARTCILEAQIRFPNIDAEHLARIAERCTEISREEALTQAARDYCAAYHPEWKSCLPSPQSTDTEIVLQCVSQQPQKQQRQWQKKRPCLDLDKENEDSDDVSDRTTKRYRTVNDDIEHECLFTDLDFEVDL